MAPMKTIAFTKVQGCVVYVESRRQPLDAEWEGYMTLLRDVVATEERARVLVQTEGGWPTARQRRQIYETVGAFTATTRCAVVTASAVTRTAVNALNWLVPIYRVFPPEDLDSALAFLGISDSAVAEAIKATLRALAAEIG